MSIAKHYESGQIITEHMYQKLLTARTFRAGTRSLNKVNCGHELATSYPFFACDCISWTEKVMALYFKLYTYTCFFMFQLGLSTLDLELHTNYRPGGAESAIDVERRIVKKYKVFPSLPDTRHLCVFFHIFVGGYEAGYYGYEVFDFLLNSCKFSSRKLEEIDSFFYESVLEFCGSGQRSSLQMLLQSLKKSDSIMKRFLTLVNLVEQLTEINTNY